MVRWSTHLHRRSAFLNYSLGLCLSAWLSGTAEYPEETKKEKEEEDSREGDETLWGMDMFTHMAMLEEKRRRAGAPKPTAELNAAASLTTSDTSFGSSTLTMSSSVRKVGCKDWLKSKILLFDQQLGSLILWQSSIRFDLVWFALRCVYSIQCLPSKKWNNGTE